MDNSLGKQERLCGRGLLEHLFAHGSKGILSFPVRLVYLKVPEEQLCGVRVLVSVSKRHFKRAVRRNRVKRQLREYYRHAKGPLIDKVAEGGYGLMLAFLFIDSKLWTSRSLCKRLDQAMEKLLTELSDEVGS